MKIAYFDCFSGVSGDMIVGALLDAGLSFDDLKNELDKLQLDGYEISYDTIVKQNIASVKFHVDFEEQSSHRHLRDLNEMVENSTLSEDVVETAKSVFLKIAKAEAKIHDMPLEKVHFHEVGAIDTIIDVVGAIVGLKLLGVEKVYASRINTGTGFVTFSHGQFPVPAPATAEILKEIPVYHNNIQSELATPTGAAILAVLAANFGELPGMKTESIGYGAGTKDLEQPNVLRVYIGEMESGESAPADTVSVVETVIDDMNPQWYESVMEKLFKQGAIDVFLTQVIMKKSRPGVLLTMLCLEEDIKTLSKILFQETTTLGLRIREDKRIVLERETEVRNTPYGKVRMKKAYFENALVNYMPEYEDVKQISIDRGVSIKRIYEDILAYLNKK